MTVDTEADNQWAHGIPLSTANVGYWEPFQRICQERGVAPTYLVTSEIAADPAAQVLLRRWISAGAAEVGAHLHPWTTPPFDEKPGFGFNDRSHAFISELPIDLVRAKLETLTGQIQDTFGVRPTAFRAGRFGLNNSSAQVLAELGYLVDSSVTPLTNWSRTPGLPNGLGGPDFSSHSSAPFIVAETGDPGLLEIPVTVTPTYDYLRRSPALLRRYQRSIPVRALRKASRGRWPRPQPVWLHPAHLQTPGNLQKACESQVTNYGVAVMMVHSSELMPGGSPRTPTPESVRAVLARLEVFLDYCLKKGIIGMTLSEAAVQIRAQRRLEVHPL
ncbi:MAG: hypothetical protein GX113_06420 [Actinobacteria bacterium]|jgi:hypothetical protein|nr:hypothetical protein [Actinomycetota bacterium]